MAIKKTTKAFDFLTILKCLKSQAELELRYPHLANKSLPIYFQGWELKVLDGEIWIIQQ